MSYLDYIGRKIWYEEHGSGDPLFLLHGNTSSSRMFDSVLPLLSARYRVITMDFLGCGRSEHVPDWPADLWYEWSRQALWLIESLGCRKVGIVGCSGGALAALNAALECPERISAVIADSFEGLRADPALTEQIRLGRAAAKKSDRFCQMLRSLHGDDWEQVLDADTKAVLAHAETVGSFCRRPIKELAVPLMLTGSEEDEMFPEGHYAGMFRDICRQTSLAQARIFPHGSHPAMLSNQHAFAALCQSFFPKT